MMREFRHLLFVTAVVSASVCSAAQRIARFTVDAGKSDRVDTPVSVELKDVTLPEGAVRLVEIKGDQRIATPCQRDGHGVSFILDGKTPSASRRVYELSASGEQAQAAVQIKEDEKGLDVVCGGKPVLRYNSAIVPPPQGQDKRYERSAFIHPLTTRGGATLTQIHLPDHIHHMGLWNAWTTTEFEGRKIDFWNLKDGKGTVRFVKYTAKTSGPVFGQFAAQQDHVDLSAPGGEKVALNEVFDVKVWNLPKNGNGHILDVTERQKCASDSPLKLPAYRYGGIGFRATAEWNKNNSNYLTSEGKDRVNGHATRAKWVLTFGTTSKGDAGIEFMSHPQNREHPEPVRIWPEGPIFFNFCPIQKTEWTLEPGKEYTLRYRLYVYDGKVSAEDAERMWKDFADPPKASVE